MEFKKLSFDFSFNEELNNKKENLKPKQKIHSRSIKTKEEQFFKRFKSEQEIENIIDWEFEQGAAYHIISGGDIDSLTFLKMVLRQQKVNYLALSTWCMALQDVEEMERWLKLGRIDRLDCYVGEIFKGSYRNEWNRLCEILPKYNGRAAIFRNHSKVIVGFGNKFDFVIESSANINTNPRTENTVITINSDLANFYKDFFDDIVSFERNFDDWKKWKAGD